MKTKILSLLVTGFSVILFCTAASADSVRKAMKVGENTVQYTKTQSTTATTKSYKMNLGKVGESDIFAHFTTYTSNKNSISITPHDTEQKVKSRAFGLGFNF